MDGKSVISVVTFHTRHLNLLTTAPNHRKSGYHDDHHDHGPRVDAFLEHIGGTLSNGATPVWAVPMEERNPFHGKDRVVEWRLRITDWEIIAIVEGESWNNYLFEEADVDTVRWSNQLGTLDGPQIILKWPLPLECFDEVIVYDYYFDNKFADKPPRAHIRRDGKADFKTEVGRALEDCPEYPGTEELLKRQSEERSTRNHRPILGRGDE